MNINVVNKRTFKGKGEIVHRASPRGMVKGSPLGNPFHLRDVNDDIERAKVIEKYRVWLWNHIKDETPEIMDELRRLYEIAESGEELNLICFCAPKPCHRDVIKNCLEWMKEDIGE